MSSPRGEGIRGSSQTKGGSRVAVYFLRVREVTRGEKSRRGPLASNTECFWGESPTGLEYWREARGIISKKTILEKVGRIRGSEQDRQVQHFRMAFSTQEKKERGAPRQGTD